MPFWNLLNQIKPMYNCVITNVPGPQVPLYNTGARMLSNLGTGPVLDSVGLFHVISSYCGEFSISITSCRELMPDPEFYRQCLQDAFDALLAATVGRQEAEEPAAGATAGNREKNRRKSTTKTAPKKKPAARKAKSRAKAPPAKTAPAKATPKAKPKLKAGRKTARTVRPKTASKP